MKKNRYIFSADLVEIWETMSKCVLPQNEKQQIKICFDCYLELRKKKQLEENACASQTDVQTKDKAPTTAQHISSSQTVETESTKSLFEHPKNPHPVSPIQTETGCFTPIVKTRSQSKLAPTTQNAPQSPPNPPQNIRKERQFDKLSFYSTEKKLVTPKKHRQQPFTVMVKFDILLSVVERVPCLKCGKTALKHQFTSGKDGMNTKLHLECSECKPTTSKTRWEKRR